MFSLPVGFSLYQHYAKQEISLKKIFGGSPSKTSEFGSCAMFLVSLLLGALFAERYASESFQILGTSPAKTREQCY